MATSKAHHFADKSHITISDDKKRITFYPRGLNIIWGADSRYWRLPAETTTPENSTNSTPAAAELMQVSWLEVSASTEIKPAELKQGKKYKISFEISLKPDAFGWNGCQVFLMAKMGKQGRYKWTKVPMKEKNPGESFVTNAIITDPVPVSAKPDEKQVYFGLYEVWSGKWKGGLQIHKAIVEEIDEQAQPAEATT